MVRLNLENAVAIGLAITMKLKCFEKLKPEVLYEDSTSKVKVEQGRYFMDFSFEGKILFEILIRGLIEILGD